MTERTPPTADTRKITWVVAQALWEVQHPIEASEHDGWRDAGEDRSVAFHDAESIVAALNRAHLLPPDTPRAAIEALRFYADHANYEAHSVDKGAKGEYWFPATINVDDGKRARDAIGGLATGEEASTDALIEALQFYANEFNWTATVASEHPVIPTIIAYADRGERARAALAASQPKDA